MNLQGQLEKRQPFLPKYDIRGSITQFDEEVGRDQSELGLPKIALPASGASLVLSGNRARQFGAIALDLSMINTADLTLVPGVSSKNLVVLARDTTTNQASAALEKIGISFNFTYGRTEGPAQALRAMVELATIELFGKLLRLPYWECLRVPSDNPRVQKELDDWFFAMSRNHELVGFFQEQLRNRGFYSGPIDNVTSPDLERAVAAFRHHVGVAPGTQMDRVTFVALVLQRTGPAPVPVRKPVAAAAPAPAPVAAAAAPSAPGPSPATVSSSAAAPVAGVGAGSLPAAATSSSGTPPTPTTPPAATPPSLGQKAAALASAEQQSSAAGTASISPAQNKPSAALAAEGPTTQPGGEKAPAPRIQLSKQIYRAGEEVKFKVFAPADTYLYCYLHDNAGQIQRIFPNRFTSDARVPSTLPIEMPGAMGFVLHADASGVPEQIGCFTALQDISGVLPAPLRIADFARVNAPSLEELAAMFTKAAGASIGVTVVPVEVNRGA